MPLLILYFLLSDSVRLCYNCNYNRRKTEGRKMGIIREIFDDKFVKHLFGSVIVYVVLSVIVLFITQDFLNLMLGWNIILAFVPVFLSVIIYQKSKEDSFNKVLLLFLILSWIAFFPNSYYVITDFIHLGTESFYYREHIYAPLTYIDNFEGYLTLTHIFLGAFIAVVMASYSLRIMHQLITDTFNELIGLIFIVGIISLSSIGIYIGRFLRLQSWDMINPIYVINELLDSFNKFSFQFIIIFILIQLALYYFIKPMFIIKKL